MSAMTTQPSSGAMRAANEVALCYVPSPKSLNQTIISEIALIIDRETAHADLLAALNGMLDMVRFADQDHDGFACGIALEQSQIIAARAAIAKAEGH